MDYYIDIIDTENDEYTTILETAKKDSIALNFQGKDRLDDLVIVGSNLFFNMNVPYSNDNDAVFVDLFTGDEQRYKVELRRETDDLLIWQGYLLPDSYSEPYTGSTYFVDFEAVDGLGRLKGKYLPDEFYKQEKSVVEIVAKCLELTGLQMELVFSPGVDNRLQKRWDLIYIDTSLYIDGSKKETAYDILEQLCVDTVSCVYQHLNSWYFEGLNMRNLTQYDARKYTYEGVYISQIQVNRTVKLLDNKLAPTPSITMVAPYNAISVEYTGSSVTFPQTIAEEKNDGWVVFDGYEGLIYATDWYGHGDYFAKAQHPSYRVNLRGNNTASFNDTKYVSLSKRLYVIKNQKISLKAEFEIDFWGDSTPDLIQGLVNSGLWTNPLKYEILLGQDILYTNRSGDITTAERLKFGSDKTASLSFEFIPQESGLIDIRFYQPAGVFSQTRIRGFFIESLTIEEIGFESEKFISSTINADYTLAKDLELTFTDNSSGTGNVFRLAKLNDNNPLDFNEIEVPVLYGATYNSINYAVVHLDGANLIADNIDTVEFEGSVISGLEVIYNFSGGEEMLIKTPVLYDSDDVLTVKVYKKIDQDISRDHWQEWTDSLYQIERKRFAEAVLGVYRRLFETPRPKIDGSTNCVLVLFGDMVRFNYIEEKVFSVTNTKLNFANGNSTITMFESAYEQAESNIPPFVDAGPDVFLTPTQQATLLNATAFDPDGTIVTWLWEKLSGASGEFIQTPATEDTYVYGLTGNDYTFKITVTDDDGNTASDTCRVVRSVNYTIGFELESSEETGGADETLRTYTYNLTCTPALQQDVFLVFNAVVTLLINFVTDNPLNIAFAGSTIIKNGIEISSFSINTQQDPALVQNTSFSYSTNDTVKVRVSAYVKGFPGETISAFAGFNLASGSVVDYPGVLLGLPLIRNAVADVS